MSGDRGGFTPKGFVKLRDAIEAIGKAFEPDWTGAEQEPENWELLDGPHVQLRERAERVWKRLRPEFHAFVRVMFGDPDPCVVLNDEGEISPVPAGVWALPEAETILRDCAFEKREIFVGEAFLEAQLYVHYIPLGSQARRLREDQAGLSVGAVAGADDSDDQKTPKTQAFSPSKAEREYKSRVENWPADKPPPSREDDESWLKEEFGVPRDKAREIRKEHAPEKWRSHGRRKTGEN